MLIITICLLALGSIRGASPLSTANAKQLLVIALLPAEGDIRLLKKAISSIGCMSERGGILE